MKKRNVISLLLSIIICHMAGVIGTLFTANAITGWYADLVKPAFNPPNWLFGPVWLLLYTLMGISLYLVWNKGIKKESVKKSVIFFVIQLILNASWSIIFFGLHSPLLALINIILLVVFVIITICYFFKVSKPAAYLLVPYWLWICFATVLNYSIWQLNL